MLSAQMSIKGTNSPSRSDAPTPEPEKQGKPIVAEIEVAGHILVDQIKSLFREGNVRQITLRAADGDFSLEVPVTVGVIAGGALVLATP